MTDQTSTIPKGWKMATLGEVAGVQTGPFGSQLHNEDYVDTGTPIITVENLIENRVVFTDKTPKVTDDDKLRLLKYSLQEGDVVFSRVGSVDRCALVSKNESGWLFSGRLLRVRPNDDLKGSFIFYWMSQEIIKEHVRKIAVGATMPSINTSLLSSVPIVFPAILEQQAISAILSSLDDKMGLLREQNKTLESTAQVIFKEWFVNFNFPGATGKMIDSELGKIPEGWQVGKLGDEFDITIGRTPPRQETEWFSDKPTGKKWISIKDIGNSEMYISNTSEYLTDEAIEKFNIPLIPENTTILSFKMTVGKLAITTEEMLSNEAIAHLKIKDNSNFSTEFIYLFLKGLDFNSLGSTSSIVTAINSTMIKELGVLIPDGQILQKFNACIQPIFEKLKNNNFQIQTLSILRNTLLPKLMKGEVRIEGFKI